ncbi:amino acid adenylation domain-containing protein [Stutzerimonas stutzeri]|uniref:amino acid adenylation domain-containing protein n=1 Tax=Stutzerimonas stutzeri TaxID=316 RepID=UPI003719597D
MTSLNSQFAGVFARHPDQPALGCMGASFSYAELQARVAAIVLQLRAKGLVAGDRVGLHLSRGPDLIAALLACVHEGLCFVPLEPDFPLDRLQGIADDAQVHWVIQDEQASRSLSRSLRLKPGIAAMPDSPVLSDELPAYMMFTSGSTGRPKGVVIGRAALANFLDAATRRVGVGPHTRWLFTTTPAFDISLLEMLGPLWAGGYVEVVCAPAHKDPVALLQLLDSRPDLNTLQATPAFWRMLLKAGWQGRAGLIVLCGGEALDIALATRLGASVGQLWNCYGPTEATIWSMMAPVDLSGEQGVRLRHSLDGYRHWVVDEDGDDVGSGGKGELCIEGISLAQGYWQRSELSDQAFISWRGRRLYRTGDRVRRTGDDEFLYLGRLDDQIKLRGFRIELGEIEANLRQIDGVQDAAVRLLGAGDDACLVGYVEAGCMGAPSRVQIRRALHLTLPHYMIPSRIVMLDALPKTPSGKIDRKRLPEPV